MLDLPLRFPGAGVVDEDYRGAVGVVLFNHDATDYQGNLLDSKPALAAKATCA